MHKKYYLLLDSTNANATALPEATYQLERHIPNGTKMRMLQFNWNTDTSAFAGDNEDNGIVITLEQVGNMSDFRTTTSSLQSCCILAQIPQESLFVPASTTTAKKEGTYEPYHPCEVKISAPITSLTLSFKIGNGDNMTTTDLANFDNTLLLEIDECGCE